jgi:hypothetical protein
MLASRRRSLLSLLLAGALLGAQWLGLWHRIEHLPASGVATVAVAPGEAHASFGHDAGGVDCRLLDQLLGAEPVAAAAAAASLPPAGAELQPPAPGAPARALAWRQPAARGPPAAG